MPYDAGSDYIVRQIRGRLQRLEDEQVRYMAAAWAGAWDDVAADLDSALHELLLQATDGRVRAGDARKSQRLLNALAVIERKLNALVEQSAGLVIGQLADVVADAGVLQQQLVASQLPPTERARVDGWSRVDAGQVEAIVVRSTEQITKRSFPLSDEAAAVMRRELVRGVAVGDNPRETARRMVARTRGVFNGGMNRAMTIARTEMLDAHRAAAALSDRANADVLASWIWTSALTSRTCPSCWAMHGREFPLEVDGPEDHQCGRCVRVPKTKSWAELGFDIPEPPSLLPDATSSFDALSPTEQATVLGPKRYRAWQQGRYPMDAWATKRQTPGWRDSWVPSKAPAA